MLKWIERHIKAFLNECFRECVELEEEREIFMAAIDDFRTALAAVSAKVDKLAADVEAKLAADAEALTEAEASAVTSTDVDAVSAVSAKVDALDAVVNPAL